MRELAEFGFAVVVAILAILGRIYVADFLVAGHMSEASIEGAENGGGFLSSVLIVGAWVILWVGYLVFGLKVYRGKRDGESSPGHRPRFILGVCALIVGFVIFADILILGLNP